jgi:hypothetical protein
MLRIRAVSVGAAVLLCLPAVGAQAAEAARLPAGVPVLAKGGFVFFSNAVLQQPADAAGAAQRTERLEWIKRFRVCLTNGYENFAGRDLDDLHAAGCELFIYRWFNGFYRAELAEEPPGAGPPSYYAQFPRMIELFREIRAHPEWLLNPDSPMQGAGAAQPAYFYDYANAAFRQFFAASIRRDLDEARYDGVFFDYIGSWALPAEVTSIWKAKHPQQTYDEAGILFLQELRKEIGSRRIFGNQAYRLVEGYYDLIDYDASESIATSYVWGKEAELQLEGKGPQQVRDTFYRSWDGTEGLKEAGRDRVAKVAGKPRVRVCDINYLQPWYVPTGGTVEAGGRHVPAFTLRTDRPAIFYSFVASTLLGGDACASDWYAEGYGRDDVYFVDLGKTLGPSYAETPDAVARYFANGFVVLTRSNGRVVFRPDPTCLPADLAGLWDAYEGTRVHDWQGQRAVTIHPAYYPSTQSYYPSGRIYLYLR